MGVVKYTGPVASFHCPTNAEIRSLKVHFSPKQEGSGDPSPENVREIVGWDGVKQYYSGKNIGHIVGYSATTLLTPYNNRTITNTYGTTLSTIEPERSIIITQSQTPDTSIISNYRNGYFAIELDNLKFDERYDISFKVTNITSNPLNATLNNLGLEVPYGTRMGPSEIKGDTLLYKNIKFVQRPGVYINQMDFDLRICGMSFTLSDFMITPAGMNDGVYEPYNGSITDYEFGVLGKNKFDGEWESGSINTTTGQNSPASDSIRTKNMIPVTPGEKYTISRSDTTSFYMLPFAYKKDGSFSRYLGAKSNTPIIFSMDDDEYYLKFYLYQRTTPFENCQLELGSTATAYEPYDPKHTVYGGWVNLITGEVNETNIVYTGGWVQYAESNGYKRYELTNILLGDKNNLQNISNITTLFSNISSSTKDNRIQPVSQGSASIRAYLSLDENINVDNIQYGYKLATPNTYYLTPTEMQTFLGQNNVWSNADYVEVEYDLHETQDILARKQFIIANQPHIVKPAAAPLQNFVTDMAVPLKECKVHFSPVQEGTGDPSPDNVRPISGWTGVTGYCAKDNLFSTYGIEYGKWTSSTGNVITDASYGCITQKIPVNGGTFSLRALTFPYSMSLIEYGADKEFIERHHRASSTSVSTFTLSANTKYIAVQVANWGTNSSTITETYLNERGILLVQGEATPEVYTTPTVYSIDWTDSAGTVYGGYIDLVTGEVVREAIKITTNEIVSFHDITDRGNGVYEICLNLPIYARSERRTEAKCNCFVYGNTSTGIADRFDLTYVLNQKARQVRISHYFEETPTIDVYKEYLQNIGFEIVYYIDQENYLIDPTALKTLRNTNNIWSTANGDVEIAYWTH